MARWSVGKDGCMDGWTAAWMNRVMDGWTDGRMPGSMVERMQWSMDRGMHAWIDG